MDIPKEPEKITIRINTALISRVLKVAAALGIVAFCYWAVMGIQTAYVASVATELFGSGYRAMAFEEIDPYRHRFVADGEGCGLLLDIDLAAEQYDRLEWGYEACKRNRVNAFMVFFARAKLMIHAGALNEAIAALNDLKDFHQPRVFGVLIDTLMKTHRIPEAMFEVDAAVKAFPERENLRNMGINIFLRQKRFDGAVRLASYYKDAALAGRLRGEALDLVLAAYGEAGDKATVEAIKGARAKTANPLGPPAGVASPKGPSA